MSFSLHGNALARLAMLARVPVGKIVRNAARDFVRAAYKVTPKAKIRKSPYYKFYHPRAQKIVFVHEADVAGWDRGRRKKDRMAARLKPHGWRKVRVAAGWSQWSWFGVFRNLGIDNEIRMPKSLVAQRLAAAAADRSFSAEAATEAIHEAKITIVDNIRFDKLPGMGARVVMAGYLAAARNLKKWSKKVIEAVWRGNQEHSMSGI